MINCRWTVAIMEYFLRVHPSSEVSCPFLTEIFTFENCKGIFNYERSLSVLLNVFTELNDKCSELCITQTRIPYTIRIR